METIKAGEPVKTNRAGGAAGSRGGPVAAPAARGGVPGRPSWDDGTAARRIVAGAPPVPAALLYSSIAAP
ncbi:hypothetical protein [Streptomyces zingiberis]|uniref:Uncharacterized protein n=1 Tax=Streptomyces zingiberis TaxID=2053010 RepID=A0ABX1BNT3_9ACTN|nr:hypothetical protein [Streptomyces zingiberis]NJP99369.1 hypothetical protein [Streptomyces zingiberis]